jgi:biopolymer transport protein ExbB/TolQ
MDFFWIMILLVVLSIVGRVVWWVLAIFGIIKVAQYANRQFEAQIREAEAFARYLPQMPVHQRTAAEAQMAQMLSNVNRQWRQMDDLARQRYDVQVGELMNMASSAGFDWTPPPY